MGTAKHIGRVGALAAALGIRNARRNATRLTTSIGVAVLVVMATVGPVPTVAPEVRLAASTACKGTTETRCAMIMGGTTVPTPDDAYIEVVKNHYIAPTHPGDIDYVAVTTPEEFWPITGLLRLLATALGPPYAGFDSPVWPDEPWWKLSGLFDLTIDQSVQAGVADLEDAMADSGNDHLVIYGLSQGATVANTEKQRLAEQYPDKTTAPDIDFVLGGDPNLPNGGLFARFPGLYIPILDWSFNGPEPTDTPFDTVVITRQYDAFADFPLYPLNLVADLNAFLGFIYVHMYSLDVSLAPDPTTPPPIHSKTGDTDYYFFQTQDLPLFGPLRTLGVPESLIDVVEPFFRVLVELGYDRSIAPWEPTPARLIPRFDPVKLVADLVAAIGEGINNAVALVDSPSRLSIPAPVTLAARATETAQADMSPQLMSSNTPTQTQQVTVDGNGDRNPAGDIDGNGDRTPQVTSTDTLTRTQLVSSEPAGATEPSTAAMHDPSASASTPKAAKPAGQPAKPRPAVRDSLGTTERPRGFRHRSNGPATSTTGTTAADPATTAGSSLASSAPAASPAASNSSAGDSSGGDAGGAN